MTEDGFEYAGTTYPSPTKIAKKITGAHWSGPRFFGLVRAIAPHQRDLASPRERRRTAPFTEAELTAMRGGLTAEEYRLKLIRNHRARATRGDHD